MIFETERLILREFKISDAPKVYALNADPEVLKYTGDLPFRSVADAKSFLQNYDAYQKTGYGRWAVIKKSNQEFIGWCGLKLNEENLVDIGFRFFQKEWNKGYATEAAKACILYGIQELGLENIIGRADENNTASIRVLEKIGLTYWKKQHVEGFHDAVYYQLEQIKKASPKNR